MQISEKTTISLFAVLAALPFIIGFIFWLSSVDAKASKGAASAEVVYEIRDRVIRIEALLEKSK